MTPVALALMLKAPTAGAVKTRLAVEIGAAKACEIYRQLVERQVRALPGDFQTIVFFDPPNAESGMRTWLQPLAAGPLEFQPQCTGDLGARLAAAFTHAFRLTQAAKVIALGGDCPALGAVLLRAAAVALDRTDVVVGPASDGGYYLLGLRAPQPALFEGVAWSTAAVLEQTRRRIHAGGLDTIELAVADDVDDLAGWRRAVAQGWLVEAPTAALAASPLTGG